jgi:hypothetical protein
MLRQFLTRAQAWTWYHATRAIAVVLLFYAIAIENDPGNRGTMVTAAFGLLGAEPVARRDKRDSPSKE